MTDDSKVHRLDAARSKGSAQVALMTAPPPAEMPKGPFTVTIADPNGKMFEVTFPDHHGDPQPNDQVLGTVGCCELFVDLLTGALRIAAGNAR